ncbi:MAG: hypothetical protein ACO2PN_20215 [Pyrobaculum sp.]|jgi:hypothetical protein
MEVVKPVGFPARYVVAGVASVLAVAVFWLVYTWPVAVQYLPNFKVEYSKGIGKVLQLEVVNETGHPVVFCATLYGWLPNGTFMNIGWRCGKGVINLDKRPLDKYVKHYANIPGDVGVVVFLTYINGTEGDKPALARYVTSFAVDPRETPRRDVVKATIKVKSRGAPQRQDATAKYSLQRPPSQIDEGCIVINGWYMCYYWKLDYIYDAGYNTQIPLTAVRVLNDYYKFDTLFVRAYLQVSGRNYIYFRGSAAISYMGVSTGYSADIYTITLREQKVYLDLQADLEYPSRPVVFAAGFYGDYALARYKEVERSSRCPFGCETGYTADVYLVRPIFQSDGTIQSFVDTDYAPDDANGLSRFFITANRYWNYLTARDDYFLYLDSIDVKNSVNGVDVFSVGIPWPFKTPIPIDVSLTVGVGQVVQTEAFAVALAILREAYRRTDDVVGRYYTPNAEFRVGDYETRIVSLLVDVYTVPQR